jgi:hypothetical protein
LWFFRREQEVKALERRLESVLGELAENVPPKYEEDEAIEITLSMLVVSGELLRQCRGMLHQADLRHWSTRGMGSSDATKLERARRWDRVRKLFVDVHNNHGKRAKAAVDTFDNYAANWKLEDIQSEITASYHIPLFSQTDEVKDLHPALDKVMVSINMLLKHCTDCSELESMMKSQDIANLDAVLAKYIEEAVVNGDNLTDVAYDMVDSLMAHRDRIVDKGRETVAAMASLTTKVTTAQMQAVLLEVRFLGEYVGEQTRELSDKIIEAKRCCKEMQRLKVGPGTRARRRLVHGGTYSLSESGMKWVNGRTAIRPCVLPFVHFVPDLRRYLVALFLK